MQEISILPGRIRLRDKALQADKKLSRYMNAYIDNLYGVRHSNVNESTASMLIVFDPKKTTKDSLIENIRHALISIRQKKPETLKAYDDYSKIIEKRDKAKKNIAVFGLIYLALKVKNSLFGKFALSTSPGFLQAASLVTLIGGYPLLKSYYKKMAKAVPADSDILLTLTALSFTLLRESSKGVLLLMLKALNDYLKYAADAEGQRLLNQSLKQTPDMVWLVTDSGQEVLVSLQTLQKEDHIVTHQGETVPVNGSVIAGSGLVNSLYCTGQPSVTRATQGFKIHEGMSVLEGSLTVLVEEIPSIQQKAGIKKEDMALYQKVAGYQRVVTPWSLFLGTASFIFTRDIMRTFAILLALTPSGSVTAFSTGLKSSITLLNKQRIFLRKAESLEKLVTADRMVFDKTGTLTESRMGLAHMESLDDGYSVEALLKICAACETDHYHPIALTLKESFVESPDLTKVAHSVLIPSRGVRAVYDGHDVLFGNRDFLSGNDIDITLIEKTCNSLEIRQLSPVLISIDGQLAGIMAFSDILRPNCDPLVQRLKNEHQLKLTLLTGDNAPKAESIARKLGIEEVYGDCSHVDKAQIVEGYKEARETVLMAGDGINDRDAMAKADVSISFADDSCDQVKIQSDLIILENEMLKVADMMELSKRAYQTTEQTLSISRLYNFVFGILALTGHLDAFAAKSFNTVNSLLALLLNKRIEYYKPRALKSPQSR